MDEQSKATKRRFHDGMFQSRYFVGQGLDVGAGRDGLSRHGHAFPRISDVRDWDVADGDAQYLNSLADGSFDFLVSSHCLEHVADPNVALKNWIRVVKSGGYLVITVPDEDMYEGRQWPSAYNGDHKWSFTIWKHESWSPRSISLLSLLMIENVMVERIVRVSEFFDEKRAGDQTLNPNTESALEFVLRKL